MGYDRPMLSAQPPRYPMTLVVASLLAGLQWFKLFGPSWQSLPNVSPWLALSLGSAWLLPSCLSGWLVASLAFCGMVFGLGAEHTLNLEGLMLVGFLLAASRLGSTLTAPASWRRSLAATALMSLGYYVASNSLVWLQGHGYSADFGGWWQAQTIGLPGFPRSLMFLRNSLAGDVGLMALLLAFRAWETKRAATKPAALLGEA